MKSYRGNAIAVGVLFILCSVASIMSIVPLGARVGAPVDFTTLAANDSQVVLTALIEFVWAAAGMGIVIALYPVLRLFNPTLALGSVFGRVVENIFILIGTLSLLAADREPAGDRLRCYLLVSGHRRRLGRGAGMGSWVCRGAGVLRRDLPVQPGDVQIETRSPMAVGLGPCAVPGAFDDQVGPDLGGPCSIVPDADCYARKILSIGLPLASSSTSLSR